MERLPISPSFQAQYRWARRGLRQLVKLIVGSLALLLAAYWLYQQAGQQVRQANLQRSEHNRLAQQLTQTEQEIGRYKTLSAENHQNRLSRAETARFLNLLEQLPLQGGLESVQFYRTELQPAHLKLVGSFSQAEQFAELESDLKARNIRYELEYLETNDADGLAFSVILHLTGD